MYVEKGSLTERQYEAICKAVKDRKNILVSGGTSSGKTTLCNAIIAEISKYDDRVVIIEDTQELQCSCNDKVKYKNFRYCKYERPFKINFKKKT